MKRIALFASLAAVAVSLSACYISPETVQAMNEAEAAKKAEMIANNGPVAVNGGSYYDPAVGGYVTGTAMCGMDKNAFAMLVNSVGNAISDDDKESIIQSAVSTNSLTTGQLKSLMELMSFDEGKLNIASSACRHLCDPQNVFMLYDAVTFSDSKEKLKSRCSPGSMAQQPVVPPVVMPPAVMTPPVIVAPPAVVQPGMCGMPDPAFRHLVEGINREITYEAKKNIIIVTLSSAMINVSQLKTLMKLVGFNENKVDIAQIGCPRLCDPQNAYLVYDEVDRHNARKLYNYCPR